MYSKSTKDTHIKIHTIQIHLRKHIPHTSDVNHSPLRLFQVSNQQISE